MARGLFGDPSDDNPRSGIGPESGFGTPPPAASPEQDRPDPLQRRINRFERRLGRFQPAFLDVFEQLRGISQGEDPRFEAFRQMRLGDANAQNAEFFGRRGTAGSTAALNQGQRTTDQITSSLGMQQLQRQDTARMGSLDVLRGFLENETLPIQLLLQQMAAQNAETAANMAGDTDPFLKLGPISVG